MKSIDGINIEVHADDYGETLHISSDILNHMLQGNLDGISILPNMKCFDEMGDMLKDAVKNRELPFLPLMSIHVDVVEGRLLSGDGLIPWNWKNLFLVSYGIPVPGADGKKHGYKETLNALRTEISAQLSRTQALIDDVQVLAAESGLTHTPQKLRVDAHQHSHMIPIVWRALTEAIADGGYEVDYIRNSHEPLGVFLKHTGCHWNPVNILKNRILTFYAPKVEKYLDRLGITPMYAYGLVQSGEIDLDRTRLVMPDMVKLCKKKGRTLEIVIHPGQMLESEMNEEIPEEAARGFLLTEGRKIEAETVRKFHDYMDEMNR